MEELENVVAANRALLARARELNVRAGEDIFPVPSRDELTKLFSVALGGARRVAEINNLSALLLPALDERLVEKVLREQPALSVLEESIRKLKDEHYGNDGLPQELRSRLFKTYYGYWGGATTIAAMKELIAEVNQALGVAPEKDFSK